MKHQETKKQQSENWVQKHELIGDKGVQVTVFTGDGGSAVIRIPREPAFQEIHQQHENTQATE